MKKLIVLLSVLLIAAQASALTVDLVNGDFETGDLTGWTTADELNYVYAKAEVVVSLGGDPVDKGNYVFEGNDYNATVVAASDVWQADTKYTISLDIYNSPGAYNPFIAVNPGDNGNPWSGWSSGSPWRFGIGGLGETLPDGWQTREIIFTTPGAGGLGIGQPISIGFQLWSNSGNAEDYVRMDNISLSFSSIKIVESCGTTIVNEIDATYDEDTYTIALKSKPTSSVTVTCDPYDSQINLNGGSAGAAVNLTFTTANWDTAQTVTVKAESDTEHYEGASTATIEFSSSSNDSNYDGISIPDLDVTVVDPSNGTYGDFVVYGFWGDNPFVMEKLTHKQIGFNSFNSAGDISSAASGWTNSVDLCHRYGVKAIIGFGDPDPFMDMWDNSDGSRDNFVSNLTQWLIDSGADGVDFDREWEPYPMGPDYDALIVDCKAAFAPYNFTVSADVYIGRGELTSTGLGSIDHLNLMDYASLGWAIDMINYWLGRGAASSTIMIGMADGWDGDRDEDSYGFRQEIAIEKTQYAIDNGFGGVMIFRTDMDSMDPATSLLQAIRDTIINHYGFICEPTSVYDLDDDKKVTLGDFAMFANIYLEPGGMNAGDLIGFTNAWLLDLGLVGHWKFDQSSGDIAAGSAYCDQSGTLTNMEDADWVAAVDRPGNALEFDGVDEFVEITDYKGVTGSAARTVTAWIKTSTTGEIITWGTASSGEKWIFRVQDDNGTAGAIRLEVGIGFVVGSIDLRDGDWHHVAAVLEEGDTDILDVKLYVNGVLETLSASDGPRQINTASGADVKIGVFAGSDRYFTGQIDDVRIYSRGLSDTEIWELAN